MADYRPTHDSNHGSKKSGPLVQVSTVEKLEEEIKSKFYEWREGKVWVSKENQARARKAKNFTFSVFSPFPRPRFAHLQMPIYIRLHPSVRDTPDLFISVYQAVCFPVYGIPKVRRKDYIAIDRNQLRYLNALEGFNCLYCSYGNGILAYVAGDRGANRAALVPDQARAAASKNA